MITAEVAIYPIKANSTSNIINQSIQTLDHHQVNYSVNSMNTHISGSKGEVFESIQSMFEQVERQGIEFSMVVSVTNAVE